MQTRDPTLTLTYLPHLDYNLQRLGPDLSHPRVQQDLREIDAVCGRLIDAAQASGRSVIVVSEYGITPVRDAVHINVITSYSIHYTKLYEVPATRSRRAPAHQGSGTRQRVARGLPPRPSLKDGRFFHLPA